METIKFWLFGYMALLTTWWWLVLGATAFFGSIVFVLKYDDYTLSTWKAFKLSFAGVVDLIPFVGKLVPNILVIDFGIQWLMVGIGCSFRSFVLVFLFLSFFFAPVLFLVTFGMGLWDYLTETELGAELREHGIGATIKMRLRG